MLKSILVNIKIVSKVTALVIMSMILYQWYGIIKKGNDHLHPIMYTITELSPHNYEVDLGDSIDSGYSNQYLKLAKWIRERDKLDKITFIMHSYGGSVMNEGIIISAIKSTKATTVAHVVSGTFSAGSTISCACNEVQMDPYTFLMFHQPHASGKQLPLDMVEAMNRNLEECKKHNILNDELIYKLNKGTTQTEYYYWKGKEVRQEIYIPPNNNSTLLPLKGN